MTLEFVGIRRRRLCGTVSRMTWRVSWKEAQFRNKCERKRNWTTSEPRCTRKTVVTTLCVCVHVRVCFVSQSPKMLNWWYAFSVKLCELLTYSDDLEFAVGWPAWPDVQWRLFQMFIEKNVCLPSTSVFSALEIFNDDALYKFTLSIYLTSCCVKVNT